jgi:hypothetical protein
LVYNRPKGDELARAGVRTVSVELSPVLVRFPRFIRISVVCAFINQSGAVEQEGNVS